LAIFASLMLLVSALAGMQHTRQQGTMDSADFAEQESAMLEQPVANNVTQQRASKKKGFKVSLFLFRLD
jgi:hypothetical protein